MNIAIITTIFAYLKIECFASSLDILTGERISYKKRKKRNSQFLHEVKGAQFLSPNFATYASLKSTAGGVVFPNVAFPSYKPPINTLLYIFTAIVTLKS